MRSLRFRVLGFRVLGFRGLGLRVLGFRGLGFRVLGFRVLGFRGLGFRVLGFRGLGFRGLGFRVCLGFRVYLYQRTRSLSETVERQWSKALNATPWQPETEKLSQTLNRKPYPTHRPLSSSVWGLSSRILTINHKKELLRSLWVNPKPYTL